MPVSLDPEVLKRQAAARALEEVESGMVLGLGTGSTMAHFLELLADAIRNGTISDVRGLSTSVRTDRRARELGIPMTTLAEVHQADLTVDGADEISPELDLVKGMGGALLREKMVAQASDRMVIVADERKLVARLGTRSPLPIEVVSFGWVVHVPVLESFGGEPSLRSFDDGIPYKTDNGNLILDVRFPRGIDDPEGLDRALHARAGIVETGLFLGMARRAIVAEVGGLRVLDAPPGEGP